MMISFLVGSNSVRVVSRSAASVFDEFPLQSPATFATGTAANLLEYSNPMSAKVLLVVNCALDYSYANRHVLFELYRDRFDELVFAVSPSCDLDSRYRHVVQSWVPPPLEGLCWCADAPKFTHPALLHSFHPRLVDVAWMSHDFDYVLFTEDDCLLPPHSNSRSVHDACSGFDAVAPPIYYCPPDNEHWVWTPHPSVYPAFRRHQPVLNGERLRSNARIYGLDAIPPGDHCPMFNSFCDWLVFRRDFLQTLAGDLMLLRDVWHEAAIPTALLHRTAKIRVSNGWALWGEDRRQSLESLMKLLPGHDFVHPVKLLRYDPREIIDAYQIAVASDGDPCLAAQS